MPSLPIYTDNQGPFGGVAGVTKTIPAGSLRHVDQNIETAYAHFWGLSFQHEVLPAVVGKVEYSGSLGRKLYDLADPNKRGAALVYTGVGTATSRPLTQVRRLQQPRQPRRVRYHGVTFSVESRRLGGTGLQFNGSYTLSHAQDNLSSTFSDSGNNFNLGYLDAFDPMLDWGDAEFDARHRGVVSGIWVLPFAGNSTGLTRALAADWQLNFIFTARTGTTFSVWDCTNGLGYCMRALDPAGIDKNATDGPSTGSPNQFTLLDLTPIMPAAGTYVNPITGNSDFGPYPSTMTRRDAFRAPGVWNIDFALSKRVRFGDRYAVQFRAEAYNLLNHANMYVVSGDADVSSFDAVYGRRGQPTNDALASDERRVQFGVKFEF